MEVKSAKASPPQIEKYRDYRKFIADFYDFKKSQRAGFSFRQFAQNSGIKSPNYLQLVMRGERNLSEDLAESVAKAMTLKETEKRYFLSLVRQENAKTDDELKKAQESGLIALKKLVSKYMDSSKEEVISKWHCLLIRELTFFSDFEPSGEYISAKLRGAISVTDAEKSLQLLIRSGFLVEKNGRLEAADPVIDSGDDIFSQSAMIKHHCEALRVWSQKLVDLNGPELEMGILNLSIPAKKIPELKLKIRDFQDQILGWLQSETENDCLVQVGTYLIPWSVNKSKNL